MQHTHEYATANIQLTDCLVITIKLHCKMAAENHQKKHEKTK